MKYKTKREYYNNHEACPKCAGSYLTQTLMGFVWNDDQDKHPYKDKNEVKCRCGWTGIVDDLVPKEW